jgi:hypothetical protein
LDCRHICKTCAFHDALQAGKQEEVQRTPLIWRPQAPDQGSTVFCVLFVCKCVLDYCHRDIGALFDYPNWCFSLLF